MSKSSTILSARAVARRGAVVSVLLALGAAACTDSSAPPAPPSPLVVPPFVYVADVGGFQSLMRWDSGVVTQLTTGSNNYEPYSAGGKLVFTSTRDVMPQIYVSDPNVTTVRRVTCSSSYDVTATLSPTGDSIAFVSTRSGTPRVWLVNTPSLTPPASNAGSICDTPVALATGSADWVPESGPAWSPLGAQLAFTSTRDGVSQVYLIASGGGTPTKVTNEMLGAFQPTWSADGTMLYYVAASPALVLRRISIATGETKTIVDADNDGDVDVGGPMSCISTVCIFSSDPTESGGSMFALHPKQADAQVVFTRTAALERQPAIIKQ